MQRVRISGPRQAGLSTHVVNGGRGVIHDPRVDDVRGLCEESLDPARRTDRCSLDVSDIALAHARHHPRRIAVSSASLPLLSTTVVRMTTEAIPGMVRDDQERCIIGASVAVCLGRDFSSLPGSFVWQEGEQYLLHGCV